MARGRYQQRQRAEDAARTRQRIIDAVVERLRVAPAEPVAVEKIAAMADVARTSLRDGLRAASTMLAADRDIWRALRSMAQLDHGAVGGSVQRWEEERAAAMRRIAGRL